MSALAQSAGTVDPGLANTPTDVVLTYDGANGSVTLTQGSNTFSSGPIPVNIAAAVGGSAFLGFTGATGGATAQQQISNFTFSTLSLTNYANNVSVAAGSPSTIAVVANAAAPNIRMGSLTMAAGSTLNVAADAASAANQAYGLTFNGATLNGAATISVANNGAGAGTVTLGAITGAGGLTKAGAGRLNATGTIGGNLALQAGTLSPGASPGLLNVTGAATFTGGTFLAELNGTNAGTDYDRLAVTGAVTLGNQVTALATTLGYQPATADQLTIITGGSVTGNFTGLTNNTAFPVGTFNSVQYLATIQYTPTSVVLTNFVPVPEPAHVLLLCAAAVGVIRWRRRSEI